MARMAFNTGKFMEKALAMATYDGTLLTDLYQNPVNKEKINRGAAFIVKNYFDEYMDSRARQDSKSFHHVYEFDRTGEKSARLFKGTVVSNGDFATIKYSFTPAKMPNRFGYEFANKAEVMEENNPVYIYPKNGTYLKYKLSNGRFIKSRFSYVRNPGGQKVAGSFEKTFNQFMNTKGKTVLEKFQFFRKIEAAFLTKRRLMVPRINAGMVTDAVTSAQKDAAQISGGVSTYYV